jgi:hypothetical protein
MNFETLNNSEIFQKYGPPILISVVISYIVIKFFNRSSINKFEKPYDYYKYYIIDTSKDYLKIFLLSPVIFIVIKYLYDINSETRMYNFNIISKIVQEVYLMIIKIAKGNNRLI